MPTVFSVIPANAGIHPAGPESGPRIKSGVTLSFPQIGQKFWQLISEHGFCWWDTPSKQALRRILQKHGVSWEDIIQIELATPSEWRWRED